MKRPWYITMFCITTWLWLFILFPSVFSPETKKVSLLLPSIYGLLIALMFIGSVGIWHLKRWGLDLFFITLFLKTLIENLLSNKHLHGQSSFQISIGFIFFFVYGLIISILYYHKMQKEL